MTYFSEFKPLLENLKQAADVRDWDGLASYQSEIERLISAVSTSLETPEQTEAFQQTLGRLQKILSLIQSDVQRHRDEVAGELAQLSKDQKAAQSYLNFSSLE